MAPAHTTRTTTAHAQSTSPLLSSTPNALVRSTLCSRFFRQHTHHPYTSSSTNQLDLRHGQQPPGAGSGGHLHLLRHRGAAAWACQNDQPATITDTLNQSGN